MCASAHFSRRVSKGDRHQLALLCPVSPRDCPPASPRRPRRECVTVIRERRRIGSVRDLGSWWTLNLVAGRLVGRGALWTDPMDALGRLQTQLSGVALLVVRLQSVFRGLRRSTARLFIYRPSSCGHSRGPGGCRRRRLCACGPSHSPRWPSCFSLASMSGPTALPISAWRRRMAQALSIHSHSRPVALRHVPPVAV